ncbi:MAG: NAD(+) synthase [Bacillota bacterium]|jgi:NAD+ synthase (glutamine-hydrolysing)
MKIAVGQMPVIAAEPEKNYQTAGQCIADAKAQGVELLLLPQLAISGACVGDNWRDRGFIDDCLYFGEKLAELTQGIKVIFGNILYQDQKLSEAAYLAQDGFLKRLDAFIAPSVFSHEEIFSPSLKAAGVNELKINQRTVQTAVVLGKWQGELPQAELIINLAQLPLVLEEKQSYSQIMQKQAHQACFAFVNSCSLLNNGKTFWSSAGGSEIYDKSGRLIVAAPLFTAGVYCDLQAKNFEDEEKVFQALVDGVRKFLGMIGVKRVVLGLSGGIDSALAAVIYTAAVGGDNVLMVNMPSCYSSNLTQSLSTRLAAALKTHYAIMPIQKALEMTVDQFEKTPITSPEGQKWHLKMSSFVQENIQARDRSARILAAAAAAWGAIYTCNSNKAEMTVGYATFCGDLSGAFAAFADLWKYQVYQACRWAQGVFPEAAEVLQEIADIRPSAELSMEQSVDEGKGDPLFYPYHDYLLRAWTKGQATPADILSWYQSGVLSEKIGCEKGIVKRHFKTFEDFTADLEYWWGMYRGMGVAKRMQSPPLLALSESPFGVFGHQVQARPYFSREYKKLKQIL